MKTNPRAKMKIPGIHLWANMQRRNFGYLLKELNKITFYSPKKKQETNERAVLLSHGA